MNAKTIKRTAAEIAWDCYQANQPMDRQWLNQLKYELSSEKAQLNWARENVEEFADCGTSKHKITLAAKELLDLIGW